MAKAAFVNSCVCTKRVDKDQISFHRKKKAKLTYGASALLRSQQRNCGSCVVCARAEELCHWFKDGGVT